jgi:O-antigen/teichoic acid export membrane protein
VNPMLRNFLSLALGRYLSIAIGAVVIVLMGRALTVADYGRFFAALAAAELFAAVLDLGLNRILLKEGSAARERTGAHLFNILLIKAGLTVLMLAAMQVYASHQGPLYALVMLLAFTKVADNFAITFDAVFQIHQRMEYSAIILVFSRLVLLAVVLLGWRDQAQLLYFAWVYLGVSMISALLTVLASGRFATPRRGPIRWRETVGREGVFFALSSLLAMAATRMDMVVLKEAVDEHSLGLYAPPSRILVVFQILPLVLQTAVLPELFRLGRRDRASLGPFYSRYFQRSLLLALFPLLWTLLFADVILGRLWGAAYLAGAPWLRLLVWLLPLRFIGFAAGNVLTALDRQWERTLQQAVGVATSLALMFWLVPTRGVPGAILALLIGEGLAALLSLLAAARHGYRPSSLPALRVLAAGALAAAALLALKHALPLGFLGGLAATALVVGCALLLVRAASLAELRGLLRRQA